MPPLVRRHMAATVARRPSDDVESGKHSSSDFDVSQTAAVVDAAVKLQPNAAAKISDASRSRRPSLFTLDALRILDRECRSNGDNHDDDEQLSGRRFYDDATSRRPARWTQRKIGRFRVVASALIFESERRLKKCLLQNARAHCFTRGNFSWWRGGETRLCVLQTQNTRANKKSAKKAV